MSSNNVAEYFYLFWGNCQSVYKKNKLLEQRSNAEVGSIAISTLEPEMVVRNCMELVAVKLKRKSRNYSYSIQDDFFFKIWSKLLGCN